MNRIKKLVIGLVFVLASLPGWSIDALDNEADVESSDLAISVEGSLMSVDVQGEPLKLVLEEVQRLSRITFIIPSEFPEDVLVSEQFQGLYLEDGVRRLLKGHNYLLQYEKSPLTTVGQNAAPAIRVRILESKVLGAEEIRAIAKAQPRRRARQPNTEPEDRMAELRNLADQDDDKQLIKVLGDAIHDPEREVREVALEILQDMEDKAPVGLLTEVALRDPSPELRTEALDALAENHTEAALESLEKAMEDPDADVREQASDLIEEIKGK